MTMKNMKTKIKHWWNVHGEEVEALAMVTGVAIAGVILGRVAERRWIEEDLMGCMLTGHPYGYFTDAAGGKHAIEVTDRLMRE